jgi:hypothetical protein
VLDIAIRLDNDTDDTDSSGDELRSLRRWLLDVPEFRGRVTVREQPPEPGELGPRLEALILSLEGATVRAAGSFGDTVAAWAEARRRTLTTQRLHLEARITPDEVVVSIDTPVRDGQLDPSVRAFVNEITDRLRHNGHPAEPATGSHTPAGDNAGDDAGEPAGFADDELHALAAVLDSRMTAEAVLRTAGMHPHTFPAFDSAPSALAWWTEISHLLASGKEVHGRRRILDAAAVQYPANPVLARTPKPQTPRP